MTEPSSILITGATGSTGGALATELTRRGVPYTAMVRRESDAARLSSPAPQVVVGDFGDDDSLARALQGASKAYLVAPSSQDVEQQQLRFVEHAARAGVEHLVLLSQLGADEGSPVRFLRYHAVVERRVRELGLDFTFLRPNLFFQGLLALRAMIVHESRFFAPVGEARVSAVDVRDIAEVAAVALTESGHAGQTYTLTGPAPVTHAEIADALGAGLGRPISFVDVPPEVFAAALAGAMPQWQLDGLLEDYAHYRRGQAAAVSEAVPQLTGHPARDVHSFARDFADAFR